MEPRRTLPPWVLSAASILVLIAIWQLAGVTVFNGKHTVPTPASVVTQIVDDGGTFYWRNLITTFSAASKGWLWGNALAIALAFLVLIAPVIELPVLQIGIVSYCLPIVAIGPVFAVVFSGETPKVVLAAMSVFFVTLVGALLGLRSAEPASLDLVHAYGGGSWKKLTKVRLRAALPSLFAALRIASPAAILGAIIGEYLGADRGLGVAMITSQQSLEVARTWAIALVATGAAGLAYALTALVGRMLTPWAPRSST